MTKAKRTRQYPRVTLKFTEPSLTKQQFKSQTNINNLVSQYVKTGEFQHVNTKIPSYGYAASNDFMESMIIVEDARQMFAALPSRIRSEFDNDPASFLAFAEDPSNRPQMAEMGLLTPEAADALLLPDIAADDDLPGDTDLDTPAAPAASDDKSE